MSDSRADRLAALVAERELDSLLVTNLAHLRHLTGYTGDNGVPRACPGPRRILPCGG